MPATLSARTRPVVLFTSFTASSSIDEWLKELPASSSFTSSRLTMLSFTVTESTFTATLKAPIPTPATVESVSRCVSVLMERVSAAFTVLLSTMVLTESLTVVTSTPTPTPTSSAPAPVPTASCTASALVVCTSTVSAASTLSTILPVTFVLILFTAILLAMPPLKAPAATPTETRRVSSVVVLAAPTERDDFGSEAVLEFCSLLCSTLAVTTELSCTTPTPTFREPATPF